MGLTEPNAPIDLNLINDVALTALSTELKLLDSGSALKFLEFLRRCSIYTLPRLFGNDGMHELTEVFEEESPEGISVMPYLALLLSSATRFESRMAELQSVTGRTVFSLPEHIAGLARVLSKQMNVSPEVLQSKLPAEFRHSLKPDQDLLQLSFWEENYWLAFLCYVITSQVGDTIISSHAESNNA